jgi:hypothetical protein
LIRVGIYVLIDKAGVLYGYKGAGSEAQGLHNVQDSLWLLTPKPEVAQVQRGANIFYQKLHRRLVAGSGIKKAA